jgi:hypothetical protein
VNVRCWRKAVIRIKVLTRETAEKSHNKCSTNHRANNLPCDMERACSRPCDGTV